MKKSLAVVRVGIALLTAVISARAQAVLLRDQIGEHEQELAEVTAVINTKAVMTQLIYLGALYRILRGKQ